MGVLTAEMKRLVEEQRLGFVASVNADGTPNLSPRGTLAVWDDDTLVFADIRSPATTRNLRANGSVAVNVVDPVTRRGYRFRGAAVVLDEGDPFAAGLEFYRRRSSPGRARGIILVRVERAELLVSPAYDDGRSQAEVVAYWRAYSTALWSRHPTADLKAAGLDRPERGAKRAAPGPSHDGAAVAGPRGPAGSVWQTRLAGASATLGGMLRLLAASPVPGWPDRAREGLYLTVDACLLLGLVGLLAAFPAARGRLGLGGFTAASVGILVIRTGERLAGPQAYQIGAALLAAGVASIGIVLIRLPGPVRVAGAAWLLAFGTGLLASYAARPGLATIATVLFCAGFLAAGAGMLATRPPAARPKAGV